MGRIILIAGVVLLAGAAGLAFWLKPWEQDAAPLEQPVASAQPTPTAPTPAEATAPEAQLSPVAAALRDLSGDWREARDMGGNCSAYFRFVPTGTDAVRWDIADQPNLWSRLIQARIRLEGDRIMLEGDGRGFRFHGQELMLISDGGNEVCAFVRGRVQSSRPDF